MRYEVRKDPSGAGWIVWDTTRNAVSPYTWSRHEDVVTDKVATLNRESARWLTERAADAAQPEQAEMQP